MLLFVIGIHIDWLWLQLCFGSHGHVCGFGLYVRAVYNCGLVMIVSFVLCWSLCNCCIVLYCSYGTSCCTLYMYLYGLCAVTISQSVSQLCSSQSVVVSCADP